MNAKHFIHFGVPLGEVSRRATNFICQFIASRAGKNKLEEKLEAIMGASSIDVAST